MSTNLVLPATALDLAVPVIETVQEPVLDARPAKKRPREEADTEVEALPTAEPAEMAASSVTEKKAKKNSKKKKKSDKGTPAEETKESASFGAGRYPTRKRKTVRRLNVNPNKARYKRKSVRPVKTKHLVEADEEPWESSEEEGCDLLSDDEFVLSDSEDSFEEDDEDDEDEDEEDEKRAKSKTSNEDEDQDEGRRIKPPKVADGLEDFVASDDEELAKCWHSRKEAQPVPGEELAESPQSGFDQSELNEDEFNEPIEYLAKKGKKGKRKRISKSE